MNETPRLQESVRRGANVETVVLWELPSLCLVFQQMDERWRQLRGFSSVNLQLNTQVPSEETVAVSSRLVKATAPSRSPGYS